MDNNIASDAKNAIDLIHEDVAKRDDNVLEKNCLIFHIPHSSVHIPDYEGYVSDAVINEEIELLTDWHTDNIFCVHNATRVIAPFSRVFCDVERLPDADEPMFEHGRGYFYTHTDNHKLLRNDVNGIKIKIYNAFYLKHHHDLNKAAKINCVNTIKPSSLIVILSVMCHLRRILIKRPTGRISAWASMNSTRRIT